MSDSDNFERHHFLVFVVNVNGGGVSCDIAPSIGKLKSKIA